MTCSIGHCTNFPLQTFKRFKRINKLVIAKKVRPTGILKWKILEKKVKLKLKK